MPSGQRSFCGVRTFRVQTDTCGFPVRCPEGSCLGQVRLLADNSSNFTNQTENETGILFNGTTSEDCSDEWNDCQWSNVSQCSLGRRGSLCGDCDVGFVMTGDGCIQCNSGKMTQLFGISGGVVLFLIVSVFLFRRFSNRVKEDAKEQENEDEGE